jgi:CheY-like chemotaxis protein
VAAESAGLGQGARFRVALPAIPEPASEARAKEPRATAGRRCRVLLIEDHDDAREMMRIGLELQGHTVFEAGDGPQGLRVAADAAPEAIVVDLGLPGLDGYEVARRLRERPGLDATLLVALSGYGLPEARQRAREAGFDVHLTKPVAPDDLSDLIVARSAPQGSA